jgi:DNA-formamidopyrimidine glycosylase
MPEGHTIRRIADRHADLFEGSALRVSSPQGRFAAGASRLDGRVLQEVEARGKHLLYHFEGRRTLHVHLGLVGSFRTHRSPAPDPSPATRLVLSTDAASAYLTGPMKCELIDRTMVDRIVGHLGPDPLKVARRPKAFDEALAGDGRPIGAVLLDQGVVAGIGNVYRSEVLFLLGIDPVTPASDLTPEQVSGIWSTVRDELRRGVEDGAIITVRPREVGAATRRELPTDLRLYAYKRSGKPCLRCHTQIRSTEMAGRTIWWCPGCQG